MSLEIVDGTKTAKSSDCGPSEPLTGAACFARNDNTRKYLSTDTEAFTSVPRQTTVHCRLCKAVVVEDRLWEHWIAEHPVETSKVEQSLATVDEKLRYWERTIEDGEGELAEAGRSGEA